MLIIQEIIIQWSKESRGGTQAARRNSISDAYPFTSVSITTEKLLCVHQKIFLEERDFAHPKMQIDYLALTDNIRIGCVSIKSMNDCFEVIYTYDMKYGGAPQRYGLPQQAFTIRQNEWGQLLYNGRFPNEYTWTYRQHTCNIGLFEPMQHNVFVQLTPKYRQDRRVHLW